MPRAKANPDPAVEEYASAAGGAYRIHAYRDGSFDVFEGETRIRNSPAKINRGFGSSKYPSNRMQAEALADARNWIETFAHRRV